MRRSPAWDQVPPEFRAAQQRGFHDGIDGARKDFKNHRPPNVNNRDEYRNPHFISPPDRADYRMGFRHGYEVAVRHIYGPRLLIRIVSARRKSPACAGLFCLLVMQMRYAAVASAFSRSAV